MLLVGAAGSFTWMLHCVGVVVAIATAAVVRNASESSDIILE